MSIIIIYIYMLCAGRTPAYCCYIFIVLLLYGHVICVCVVSFYIMPACVLVYKSTLFAFGDNNCVRYKTGYKNAVK